MSARLIHPDGQIISLTGTVAGSVVYGSDTPPEILGLQWYDTSVSAIKIWNGSAWENAKSGAAFEAADNVTETEIVSKTTLPLVEVTNTDTDVYSLSGAQTVTLSQPGRYYWTVRATAAGTAAGGAWGAELVVRVDNSVRANTKCYVSRSD